MIRLLLLMVLTSMVLALLASGAGAVGAALPVRAAPFGYGTCNLPCWANLYPGKTPFVETPGLLSDSLPLDYLRLNASGSQVTFAGESEGVSISGFVNYAGGRVGYVRVNAPIPLGDLLATMGFPGCVWVQRTFTGQDLQILYWQRTLVGAMIVVGATTWQPRTNADNVWMAHGETACDRDEALAWMGFAPLRRYRARLNPALLSER